jgi:hypothetical protein
VLHFPLNESKISTTFEADPVYPPPKSAYRLSTDVAARPARPTLKVAVVHVLLALLYTSTIFEPPPKRTKFLTEVAARQQRATLNVAVLQLPFDVL